MENSISSPTIKIMQALGWKYYADRREWEKNVPITISEHLVYVVFEVHPDATLGYIDSMVRSVAGVDMSLIHSVVLKNVQLKDSLKTANDMIASLRISVDKLQAEIEERDEHTF